VEPEIIKKTKLNNATYCRGGADRTLPLQSLWRKTVETEVTKLNNCQSPKKDNLKTELNSHAAKPRMKKRRCYVTGFVWKPKLNNYAVNPRMMRGDWMRGFLSKLMWRGNEWSKPMCAESQLPNVWWWGGPSDKICVQTNFSNENDTAVRHWARKLTLKHLEILKACKVVIEKYKEMKEINPKITNWDDNFERKFGVWKIVNERFLNL
jgi:hypothetical protein